MNIEEFRNYCIAKKGVTESFPFDENTLVFKVMGKMFALANIEGFGSMNLKCEPDKAVELREQFHAVEPGYHMSKKHWNTVTVNADASDRLVFEWIDDSYTLVVKSLTKKLQAELAEL
ncbi:MmcQ/YjbR family DNA-binding protein [Crocinitomix algicola]|uniref:MmcQ/YjbR family DNA-binding protein n=1 Tax=Crocinitomix algicola TaxID=1740263 RepID=UPI0008734884|nr:MmcQ/YjbR family DNA-binding protein [Crocinitomix algicola]